MRNVHAIPYEKQHEGNVARFQRDTTHNQSGDDDGFYSTIIYVTSHYLLSTTMMTIRSYA